MATLALLALARQAAAESLSPAGNDWEGLAQFVLLAQTELGPARVRVERRLSFGELTSADALVLVHPERALPAAELDAFMQAGGRVVTLDDFGSADTLLEHFHIRRIPLPTRPREALRDNPVFAVATTVGHHPAVADVTRVVTNHATGLSDAGLAPLLVVRGRDEPDVLLAVAGTVGRGHLLAVGDASAVMNAMLRYPGNRALAVGLIHYASETAVGPRAAGGRLFILANDFELTGRFGPISPLGSLGAAVLDALRGAPSPSATYALAIAIGLGIVVWAGANAGRLHRASVPRFVRPTPVAAQGGVAGHAAALGAPGAARALVLVEIKRALEESLAETLGVSRLAGAEALVARTRSARLLEEASLKTLAGLLAHLSRYDTVSPYPDSRAMPVTDNEVADADETARRLLGEVAAASHGRVNAPP
jgi:hypothetical protein